MDIGSAFRHAMSKLGACVRTDWKFVTSGGGEVTAGTPIVHVGLNAAGGALWIQRDADPSSTELKYGGVGGSVALSLVPFIGNFSFSLPSMPNKGRVYRLPAAGDELVLDDFRGAFVMMEVCADAGPGGTGTVMFIGGNMTIAMMVAGEAMTVPALIVTSKACVLFGGLSVSVLPFNVGACGYVGAIY